MLSVLLGSSARLVNSLPELTARLEMGEILSVHQHRCPGSRVSSLTRFSIAQSQASESAKFNTFAFRQTIGNGIQDDIHRPVNILLGQVRVLVRQCCNQFLLSHNCYRIDLSLFLVGSEDFLFQLLAERQSRRIRIASIPFERLSLLIDFKRLDRQRNLPVLAVDANYL